MVRAMTYAHRPHRTSMGKKGKERRKCERKEEEGNITLPLLAKCRSGKSVIVRCPTVHSGKNFQNFRQA